MIASRARAMRRRASDTIGFGNDLARTGRDSHRWHADPAEPGRARLRLGRRVFGRRRRPDLPNGSGRLPWTIEPGGSPPPRRVIARCSPVRRSFPARRSTTPFSRGRPVGSGSLSISRVGRSRASRRRPPRMPPSGTCSSSRSGPGMRWPPFGPPSRSTRVTSTPASTSAVRSADRASRRPRSPSSVDSSSGFPRTPISGSALAARCSTPGGPANPSTSTSGRSPCPRVIRTR